MKHYFRVVYSVDGKESRDAIVGVDDILPETPISGFKDKISKLISSVLEKEQNIKEVHVYRFWDMGTEVDFINI